MKTIIETFLKELDEEAVITRKMLAIVPEDQYDWRPHPRSMTIKQLATHIAEVPGWIAMGLTTNELDLAVNQYEPEDISNNDELMALFEKNFADGRSQLSATTQDELEKRWVMRSGDFIIYDFTKAGVVRTALNQTTHHRAQLGVFLRLLDIPIPGSYGPSADEMQAVDVM